MTENATYLFPLMLIRTAGLPLQWPEWPNEVLNDWEKNYADVLIRLQETTTIAQTAFEAEKDRPEPDLLLQKSITNTRRLLRKGVFSKEIKIDPYLQEKRPDFAQLLRQVNDAITRKTLLLSQFQDAFSRQLAHEQTALVSYAGNETLQRALLFSSHILLQQLPALSVSYPESWHKKERQTASSLLKYLFRASTKTTPLSRMATVTLKDLRQVPAESDEMDAFFSASKHIVSPNVALLPAIYDVLLRDPAFYNTLFLRLNPGLQELGDIYEWLFFNGEEESFQRMNASRLLELLTDFFQKQEASPRNCDLIDALRSLTDAGAEDLQSFVFQLIDYGFLEWVLPENGLSPGWCGSLYNYLGFLPSSTTLTDAAFLLQWLRTAARTISFQPIADAFATQEDALQQCRHFFEKNHAVCPDISPEQLFYEDVAASVQDNLSLEAVQRITDEIRMDITRSNGFRDTGLYAELLNYGSEILETGSSMPFLTFCKLFMGRNVKSESNKKRNRQISPGKMGALLQFYRSAPNEVAAVLNAFYPGGGKMMARWMHLFPNHAREQLSEWWPAEVLAFPWQGWSNANFQPVFAQKGIAVAGGRVGSSNSINNFPIKDLLVYRSENGLQLREKTNMQQIILSDNGLEDPTQKPPVLRILWELGVPFVSASVFSDPADWNESVPGVLSRKRKASGAVTLLRAAWLVSEEARQDSLNDEQLPDVLYFISVRKELAGWGIPRYFFAKSTGDQSRFFDQNSPMLMQEFRKMCSNTRGDLFLSEMLPTPEQWMAESNGEKHAAEWVLEFSF